MKNKYYPISGAILAAIIIPAPAEVLLEEEFNYPNGPIVGAPASPWEAHSGAGNGPVQVEEGWLRLSYDRVEDINAPLAGAPYEIDGTVTALYAGFVIQVSELPTTTGSYFAHFRNNTTAHRARIWISQSEAADRVRLGIGNSAGASASTGPWPADLLLGEVYRVVIRYEVASGLSTIWVNPSAESDPAVTATDNVGLVGISTCAFRQSSDIGIIHVDQFRVSDRFAEVTEAGVRLQITNLGGEMQVSWPATADGYLLQGTPDLTMPAWDDVDGTPLLEEGRFVFRFPSGEPPQYFRLIKR